MTTAITFDDALAKRVEATYMTPDVAATRIAAFRALEPRAGERIADLGCGPGFMTRELGLAVGSSGRVHALDLSEPMLSLARRRCADLAWVDPIAGNMSAIPLPDGSVDGVVAMQSLSYVPDAAKGMSEIARVLRPGGRAAVLDTDFGSLVWHDRDPERVNQIFAVYDGHAPHPRLARVLGRLAADAGLVTVRRDVVPILDVSFHPNTYAYGIAMIVRDYVVASRRVSETTADAWLEECAALDRDSAFFMSLNRYLFVLRKPDLTP